LTPHQLLLKKIQDDNLWKTEDCSGLSLRSKETRYEILLLIEM